jgi:N6-adenosine-specific RNA methylase IME4
MKDKELLDMKEYIDKLSNDNSIMFMWATMPRLDFAIELMKSR